MWDILPPCVARIDADQVCVTWDLDGDGAAGLKQPRSFQFVDARLGNEAKPLKQSMLKTFPIGVEPITFGFGVAPGVSLKSLKTPRFVAF